MMKGFQQIMKGDTDDDFFKDYYSLMCEDIQREKERIGGDWAVAQCILRRDMRDFIRSKLGPELVIILLEMDLGDMKERLLRGMMISYLWSGWRLFTKYVNLLK